MNESLSHKPLDTGKLKKKLRAQKFQATLRASILPDSDGESASVSPVVAPVAVPVAAPVAVPVAAPVSVAPAVTPDPDPDLTNCIR